MDIPLFGVLIGTLILVGPTDAATASTRTLSAKAKMARRRVSKESTSMNCRSNARKKKRKGDSLRRITRSI